MDSGYSTSPVCSQMGSLGSLGKRGLSVVGLGCLGTTLAGLGPGRVGLVRVRVNPLEGLVARVCGSRP